MLEWVTPLEVIFPCNHDKERNNARSLPRHLPSAFLFRSWVFSPRCLLGCRGVCLSQEKPTLACCTVPPVFGKMPFSILSFVGFRSPLLLNRTYSLLNQPFALPVKFKCFYSCSSREDSQGSDALWSTLVSCTQSGLNTRIPAYQLSFTSLRCGVGGTASPAVCNSSEVACDQFTPATGGSYYTNL